MCRMENHIRFLVVKRNVMGKSLPDLVKDAYRREKLGEFRRIAAPCSELEPGSSDLTSEVHRVT